MRRPTNVVAVSSSAPFCEVRMQVGKLTLRLPANKAEWHHKLDHFTHGSYIAAETFFGHGILQMVAGSMLLVLIIGVLWHVDA
jgi:hypothetical protein